MAQSYKMKQFVHLLFTFLKITLLINFSDSWTYNQKKHNMVNFDILECYSRKCTKLYIIVYLIST